MVKIYDGTNPTLMARRVQGIDPKGPYRGRWEGLHFWKSEQWNQIQHNVTALEYRSNVTPIRPFWFQAMSQTTPDAVKCVILGQDPYPSKGLANGLAFSVLPSVSPIPPSLRSIHQEYVSDLGYTLPTNGSLLQWARRGVLLWNTILTTEVGKPRAHVGWGWERLTVEVLQKVAAKEEPVVFLLWGQDAQEYETLVNRAHHLVIKAPHPSPLSAMRGFFGHRPFTRTNTHLGNDRAIDWRL